MFLDPDKDIAKQRGNLPHWQQGETYVFVTWRLNDSLPKEAVAKWQEKRDHWLTQNPEPHNDEQKSEYNRRFTLKLEELLDDNHGTCCLSETSIREIVTEAFHHFDNDRYQLASYVVMPNHVHILFKPLGEHPIPDIIHTWKRFTAREINKSLDQTGTLWQSEYWDRLIRSQKHFDWVTHYIEANPEKLRNGTFTLWRRAL